MSLKLTKAVHYLIRIEKRDPPEVIHISVETVVVRLKIAFKYTLHTTHTAYWKKLTTQRTAMLPFTFLEKAYYCVTCGNDGI